MTTTQTKESGFSLIELLVIIFIVTVLAGVVSVNFQAGRVQQTVIIGADDLVSKIRQVQTDLLAGKKVEGDQAADAYELTFNAGTRTFTTHYLIDANRTLLETTTFVDQVELTDIIVNSSSRNSAVVRIDAPFGRISVDSTPNESVILRLKHVDNPVNSEVEVDGISGRISNLGLVN